jgi:putative serine protease PepD
VPIVHDDDMTQSLPPLGPRPDREEGLPPLSPRAASRGGGLPPLDAAGAPQAEPATEQRPLAQGQEGTPPPPPRRGRAGRIGRTPREPRRGGRARRATAGLIVAAALAGAVAGGATTYLLDDGPQPGVVAASGAAGEVSAAGALQDAIAAVDGSVVQVRTAGGLGSGVVTAPRGLIITNEHVAGARGDEVMVITADDRRVPATVVASDASRDLAVLRPKGSVGQGVQIAPEPDAALRAGDQVFAIGSPFGLQGTVTVGVVSAVARRGEGGAPMIQTDAPINPGNSGGGLFDLRGRLVGVPTSINSPVPGNVGIGFAVTADEVRRILGSVN